MPNYCLCGCGSEISRSALFIRGHQVRYRRDLLRRLREEGDTSIIPTLVRFNWITSDEASQYLQNQVNNLARSYVDRLVENAQISNNNRRGFDYYIPSNINRTFGIEIEFLITSSDLRRFLREFSSSNSNNNSGVIVESEHYNHTTRRHWKVVTDASLSSRESHYIGRELVSPILEGEEGFKQLKILCEALNRYGCKVNHTTGLHIHLGSEGLKVSNFKKLYEIYRFHEREIDKFFPSSRRGDNNRFCHTLPDYSSEFREANTIGRLIDITYSRYLKLNFQAYRRHKTIEFRQHSGTLNYSKIAHWVEMCNELINWSLNGDKGVTIPFYEGVNLTEEAKLWWERRVEQLS